MPSKYEPLGAYLAAVPPATMTVTLTFAEVEAILGAQLPAGAAERRWWGNRLAGRPQARAWRNAGWYVVSLSLGRAQAVTFARAATTP